MAVKVPGLGKSKGDVGFDNHLDDGDYLVEASNCEFQWKPTGGRKAEEEDCPYQYVVRTNILAGPEQEGEDGGDPAGRPWTIFLYVDPDHEYTQLMVDRVKNCLNAFKVPVRADSFKEENFAGQKAVMTIVNRMQKKGKYAGEMRSDVREFHAVEDTAYADLV